MISASTREKALQNPTAHQFAMGRGYIDHGQPPIALGPEPRTACGAVGLKDRSEHVLSVPGGGREMKFTWLAAHRAWQAANGLTGHRMAYTAEYLSSHGWTYARPA